MYTMVVKVDPYYHPQFTAGDLWIYRCRRLRAQGGNTHWRNDSAVAESGQQTHVLRARRKTHHVVVKAQVVEPVPRQNQ